MKVLIILLLIVIYFFKQEGLSVKPSEKQRQQFVNEMLDNKKIFDNGLTNAKNKLKWLDAVTYEEARGLKHTDQFTSDKLNALFE